MNMDPIKREPDIDQWLDAALSQYAKAEPRAGLEGRVLATLQAERNRVGLKRNWWWGGRSRGRDCIDCSDRRRHLAGTRPPRTDPGFSRYDRNQTR